MVSSDDRHTWAPERLATCLRIGANAMWPTRGCLLTFHRAAPGDVWDALPNRDFYVSLDFLDRALTYLRRTGWQVVTLDQALSPETRLRANRIVNFSVDDCYRDTWEKVVPLFRRHNVPVTLFVTTGIPDGTLPLWQAGLETILQERDTVQLAGERLEAGGPEAKRKVFAEISRRWDGPRASEHYRRFCNDNGLSAAALDEMHAVSWDMLEQVRGDPLVEIGAHTVTHARISDLSRDEAVAELGGCRDRLHERLGVAVRHFAFPYGRQGDCGRRDFAIAREVGFMSAATTRKGLLRTGQDPFRLPRNTLNGAHQNMAALEAHLSGLTGLAAGLLRRV